ncbi:FAD-dependent monooxygenase [Pseudoalteromonas sp. MMG013]|uniref:FAD-dependent monooxygenase n=1 Tax=Pseudoalteromonas sp. MMG013 TaxID=2822687 RepID=UPI001B385F22|nr:FAD-dependent monooxygenase [Pseudoalteromonas sp. MMG013]MBQ4864137.1 FAD-dependent monooxygenase [Pseudoalteromonas sp. MMG013]
MRVLIVGAGIAGSALFHRLKSHTIDVDIIEKSTVLTNEGAAICLPANAMIELDKLGISDTIIKCAHQVNSIEYALANGETLTKASLMEVPLSKGPFVALKRDKLMRILRAGIADKIQLHTWPTNIQQTENGVFVTLNHGPSKTYDLVVAADGINSQVRQMVQPDTPLLKHKVTNWRFIAPTPSDNFQPVYYVGNTTLFMIYPISKDEVYCYAHVTDTAKTYYDMPTKEALYSLFANYTAPVLHCLNTMPSSEHIIRGELKSVMKTDSVFQSVVLIGDALHGCPPSLQQGAGMSLEDANCLADQMINHLDNLPQALSNYEKARGARIAWTVNESNKIIKLAGLGESFIGRLVRNFILRRKGPANVVGWRKLLTDD